MSHYFQTDLITLVSYCTKADWYAIDFVNIQKIQARILAERNASLISEDEYKALYPLVALVVSKMREALKQAGQL